MGDRRSSGDPYEDEAETEGDLVVRWLEALDMQVVGGCRSDERVKPLLKLSAEDRLLAHLSQHFAAVEVGLLARCLCIPLVSLRVGKVKREGSLLCPTSSRGNLKLTVLPTSGLRLSFAGDDGRSERLFTLAVESPGCAVSIDEISADCSGRSFLVKTPDAQTFYFWCSEKSKLLGLELLAKMRDFLVRRPSIAELTGISESRLGCFATHSSKALRPRANPAARGSLSPRSGSFKDGASRNPCGIKTAAHLVVENLEGSSSAPAPLSTPEAPPLLPPLSSLLPPTHAPPFLAGPAWVDPVVHIPVIGVCSAGPGYLVSAGPTDALVEKGARETLRLLMAGSGQGGGDQAPSVIVAGLYGGAIATIGLVEALVLVGEEDESRPRPPEEERSPRRRLDSD